MSKRQLFVAMLSAWFSTTLHAQVQVPEGGSGGGGGGTGITVVITTDAPEDGNVIIGKSHAFSFTADGGTPPYSGVWSVQCPPAEGPIAGIPESPLVHCFKVEGTHAVKVLVTDSAGNSKLETKTITVSGPDDLVPDFTDVSNPSTGPGSILTMEHTFTAQVGGGRCRALLAGRLCVRMESRDC